jgi:hypothetical protein
LNPAFPNDPPGAEPPSKPSSGNTVFPESAADPHALPPAQGGGTGDGGFAEDPGEVGPPPQEAFDTPVLIVASVYAQDPKVLLVTIGPSTSVNQLKVKSRWFVKPVGPVGVTPTVKVSMPFSAADKVDSAGISRTMKLTLSEPLTGGIVYNVHIGKEGSQDLPKDWYGQKFFSSIKIVTTAHPPVLVGGEIDGRILPAVLRAFGSQAAKANGKASTRTLEMITDTVTSVRVETTIHLPDSGHVYISGLRFRYESKSGGSEARLSEISLADGRVVFEPVQTHSEVILDVKSVFPD